MCESACYEKWDFPVSMTIEMRPWINTRPITFVSRLQALSGVLAKPDIMHCQRTSIVHHALNRQAYCTPSIRRHFTV